MIDALEGAIAHLRAVDAAFALVGGLAVSARTNPRFTADVDVVVAVETDQDASRVIAALAKRGLTPGLFVDQEATGRLAMVRMHPADGGLFLDLLLFSSGIEAEIVAEAELLDLADGLLVPVARLGHLIALKLLSAGSHRPLDAADLTALIDAASPAELDRARRACTLIRARGTHHGRDLAALLEERLSAGGA